MTALFAILLLLAQPAPLTLDQIRADANLEHRAKAAVDYAAAAERLAEAAYDKGDMEAVTAALNNMATGAEIARDALAQTGKSPMHHPGPFKSAELRTEEVLVRLDDLERRMDASERDVLKVPKDKVQEIHDAWFDGIMGKKKR
jgi:hypothetical protein